MPESSHRRFFRQTGCVMRREFSAYFSTPTGVIFLVIFLVLAGLFTFQTGGFLQRGRADLQSFFVFHPWLYLLLVPAVSMRLWAEERKTGTIELLMTLPITTFQAVLGKFLAAWLFLGLALGLTFPLWITVNVLGNPDNGVILANYVASFLMAGAFLSLGASVSALTRNQIVAFILGAMLCFLFVLSGLDVLVESAAEVLPVVMVDALATFSFLTHFITITRGVITVPALVFFISLMGTCLFVNVLLVDLKKGT